MHRALTLDPANLVEPDRVHRYAYGDPEVFALEIERVFERTWIYAGHASQIPQPGDYWAFQLGRQPMVMVRGQAGAIHVLYNRCPHRGVAVCGSRSGNAGEALTCSYHAWRFHYDGTNESVPLARGYDGTRLTPESGSRDMKRAARVAIYRGFVFASLAAEGPSLEEFLGPAKLAFDDMCDRSPEGEVAIVPTCFRVIQRSNWKLFMENQLDALHPSVTHASVGQAAAEVERAIKRRTGTEPGAYRPLSAVLMPFDQWDAFQTANYAHGHCLLQGYLGLRPQDPDSLAYEAMMRERYGAERAEEIFSRNIHHVLIYPSLSVQSPLQQLRAVRPLTVDRTLTEIWHFRLKGAPEAIYRRSLNYFNLVNSPATMVNADDLENWTRAQAGLESDGGDWVSFHRNYGEDEDMDGAVLTRSGTSEAPMRNQFKAWLRYMSEAQ